MKLKVVCLTLFATALFAASAVAEPAPLPTDTKIALNRTACYGSCPAYQVGVTADGKVSYNGTDFVHVKGAQQSSVSPEVVRALVDQLQAAGFFALPEGFENKCPENWTDNPSVTLSFTYSGKSRSVHDYLGCRGNPELDKLRPIYEAIDRALNTKRWISGGPIR